MVKIRLRRMGTKKRPFFRVVVADARSPRDGRFIENIGRYHPMSDPSLMEIDEERALHWLSKGAQPSDPVRVLLDKLGIWEKFRGGGAARTPEPDVERAGEETENR
jgi:small subunit ribosomal protein S16